MKLTPIFQQDAYPILKSAGLARHDDALSCCVSVTDDRTGVIAVGCLRDISSARGSLGAVLEPVMASSEAQPGEMSARALRRLSDALSKSASILNEWVNAPVGSLAIGPISRTESNEYVRKTHRHNDPSLGDISRIQLVRPLGGDVFERVGVGTFGRPVARKLAMSEPGTVEVLRVATDGRPNASTRILGAICRLAGAMGYGEVITYTLKSEGGASLRAANFVLDGEVPAGKSWNVPSRPRAIQRVELEGVPKCRWRRVL